MQVNQFTSLLENPSDIVSEQQAQALEQLIEVYPYFQAVRGMHLIGLKNTNSFKYNSALKKHAAYTSDRSWLFEIITADAFNVKQESFAVENPETNTTKDSKNEQAVQTEVAEINENTAAALGIGNPLLFGKKERYSFEKWLSLSKSPQEVKNVADSKKTTDFRQEISLKDQKMAKIDAFLASNPKMDPQNKSRENVFIKDPHKINKEALMTETLARVYLEQKKYKKALQAYKILSLKYPEKNSFFASQIKSIQKLIKDNL
jgi:hypothetical protein